MNTMKIMQQITLVLGALGVLLGTVLLVSLPLATASPSFDSVTPDPYSGARVTQSIYDFEDQKMEDAYRVGIAIVGLMALVTFLVSQKKRLLGWIAVVVSACTLPLAYLGYLSAEDNVQDQISLLRRAAPPGYTLQRGAYPYSNDWFTMGMAVLAIGVVCVLLHVFTKAWQQKRSSK